MAKKIKVVASKSNPLALREKAITLLGKGWSTDRIIAKHPELKKTQIAAYKAHMTMGTYA